MNVSRELPVSIVIPVHNEDPAVARYLDAECRAAYRGAEVIIVDDGSSPPQPYATLRHERQSGYGAAIKTGIDAARHPWIVTLDGDGQHRIEDIARLYDLVHDRGLDMAIGDRQQQPEAMRQRGSQFMNGLASFITGLSILDLNCGLRIFRKDLAQRYRHRLSDRFSFTTTIVMAFLAEGHRVDWLPISVKPRMGGKSKVRLIEDGCLTAWQIVRAGSLCRMKLLSRVVGRSRMRISNKLVEWWRVFQLSLTILKRMVAEQGVRRTLSFVGLGLSHALQGRVLPHTPEVNATLWSHYDWLQGGTEWSKTPEWEASVVECVLNPHVPMGSRVLEIGPGAGRWTAYLLCRASHLIVVDVTPRCIELCRARFRAFNHIEYFTNDGSDLSFLSPQSIDCIWSWDVFIHVQLEDAARYLREFSRILAPGGWGVIEHAQAGYARGWRSAITAEQMAALCRVCGLQVSQQFTSWNHGRDTTPTPADLVTVFTKLLGSGQSMGGVGSSFERHGVVA